MADEYIKRKDVLECIKESRDGIDWGQSEDGDAFLHYSACLYRTIASNEYFPSADVAEVRHGKWEDDGLNWIGVFGIEHRWQKCSECGYKFSKIPVQPLYNFCPNCGADMRPEPPKEET